MLNFNGGRRIFVARGTVDMRKSFDGLSRLVRERLGHDPYSGDVFVFFGKDRNRVKVLVWDVSGYWVCAKRLEAGTFAVRSQVGGRDEPGVGEVSAAQVLMMLEGIEAREVIVHRQYKRPA